MSGNIFQIWVSGFAAFYALDNAISLWIAPADRRAPFALRVIVGAMLSAVMFAAGARQ